MEVLLLNFKVKLWDKDGMFVGLMHIRSWSSNFPVSTPQPPQEGAISFFTLLEFL
jgi:hypothetical protein